MSSRSIFRRWLERPGVFSRGFRDAPHRVARGRLAERRAREWLEENGLEILASNLVTPQAEIDLLALDGDVLCLIEVKARTSARHGRAIEAVTEKQQRRLARAGVWLTSNLPWSGLVRFDVLTLDRSDGDQWTIVHHRGAFEAVSEDAT